MDTMVGELGRILINNRRGKSCIGTELSAVYFPWYVMGDWKRALAPFLGGATSRGLVKLDIAC